MRQSRPDIGAIGKIVDEIESFIQQSDHAFYLYGTRHSIDFLHGCRHHPTPKIEQSGRPARAAPFALGIA
jgi:hypothetical protein